MSKAQPQTIEILDEPLRTFEPSEWIGQGKTYPNDDTPLFILAARKRALSLPPEHAHLLPGPQLSVSELLNLELPHQPATCVSLRADGQFSFDPPNEEIHHLARRPVPSPHFLSGLQKAFGQAWFSGAQSIVDYRYKDSRVPLCALGYWSEVSIVIGKKAKWKKAAEWLTQRQAAPGVHNGLGAQAQTCLERLSWNGRLQVAGSSGTGVESLSTFLSDNWLDDDHIDMLMGYLSTRAKRIPILAKSTLVLSLAFQRAVDIAFKRKAFGDNSPRILRDCQRLIEEGVQQVYFPIHVDGMHWVPCQLDFTAGVVRYGDSLSASEHARSEDLRRTMKRILGWAKQVFGKTFRDGLNTLAHGLQEDAHSCGICTVNSIAHNLFGDDKFTHERRDYWRINYFVMLAQEQLISDDNLSGIANSHSQAERAGEERLHGECAVTESGLATVSNSPPSPISDPATLDSPRTSTPVTPQPTPSPPPPSEKVHPLHESASLPVPQQSVPGKRSRPAADEVPGLPPPPKLQPQVKKPRHAPEPDRLCGPVGISASAQASRKLKAAMQAGTLVVNQSKKMNHEEDCRLLDLGAQFRYGRVWEVFHSRCGKWVRMKEAYDRTRFRQHVAKCASSSHLRAAKTARTQPLRSSHTTVSQDSPLSPTVDSAPRPTPKATQRPSTTRLSLTRFTTLDGWFSKARRDSQESEEAAQVSSSDSEESLTIAAESSDEDMGLGDEESSQRSPQRVPCHGITRVHESRVLDYLNRTGASGGGARSVTAIAKERYSRSFKSLNERRKELVRRQQQNEHAWRNDFAAFAVFSTSCLRTVALRADSALPTQEQSAHSTSEAPVAAEDVAICEKCQEVLRSGPFKQALRVPTPSTEKYKYLNKQYRNETVARLYMKVTGLQDLVQSQSTELSVFAQFAIGVHQGKYKDRTYMLDLIKALVEADDRHARDVGLQNFSYGPALIEFATTCAIISPEVYRILCTQFQLPTIRTLQRYRAKTPKFPMAIDDRTFDIAVQYMESLGYGTGPVALSCDDTKLHPAYRTYYDNERQVHLLVGGTDEPRAVANADELRNLLRDPTLGAKATKIRLWCLLPALPKLPPIILAAKPIPNTLSAPELYGYLHLILTGLLRRRVRVVSYSCDGTETERSVQKMLLEKSPAQRTYTIAHPQHEELALPPLTICMAVIDGYALAIIQDSKHALKTLRNNLFSGAHVNVLGNYLAMYGHALELAHSLGSPLYLRDVEKIDRQDDNAATRLFSSAALQHLISMKREHLLGTIVYLFVFGELVDAYQNRRISHSERVKMALRARFFLDIWRRFLVAAAYPESRYCISREAISIIQILVDGLIALIIIHRDCMDGHAYPLFPWLHSTEVCEHVFGECRKLVKDFTYLDFLYMIPRLSALVRAACKAARSSDPRVRAGGYAHSYFDSEGANFAALSIFPTDEEIAVAAREAWEEATNLWDLLGVTAIDLFRPDSNTRLPSVSSWFVPGDDPVWDADFDETVSDCSDGDDVYSDEDEDRDELTEAAELQKLLDAEETASGRSNATDDRMFSLSCAAVAATLDDITRLQSFDEPTEQETLADAAEHSAYIKKTLDSVNADVAAMLPPLNLDAEPIRPFDRAFNTSAIHMDLTPLTSIRRAHETDRAKNGIRTKGAGAECGEGTSNTDKSAGDAGSSPVQSSALQGETSVDSREAESQTVSIRREIIREMHQTLREEESRAAGTGLERQARWTGTGPTGTATSGNTANAVLAAGQRAAAVTSRRGRVFKANKVPKFEDLCDALIALPSTRQPRHSVLQPGSYGIIFHQAHLYIGRVLAIYSRMGGKAGAHAWQADSKNIGLVSYLVVQVYERTLPGRFRAIHGDLAFLQVMRFAHLPSDQFLCRLDSGSAQLSQDARTVEIDRASYQLYQALDQASLKISASIKALTTARRKKAKEGDVDGEDVD